MDNKPVDYYRLIYFSVFENIVRFIFVSLGLGWIEMFYFTSYTALTTSGRNRIAEARIIINTIPRKYAV